MTDITSRIVAAESLATGWGREKVRQALSALAELYPEGTVDWEEGDEDWGRVVSGGGVIAFVSAIRPIAFVLAHDELAAQRALLQMSIVIVPARDFDDRSFIVDPSVLSELARRPLTKNVSYNRASVNDIWWATV
jgi:hypothetical protein